MHDLAILRAPEAFPRWHRLYGRAGLERVLRAADAVVAVSEFTRAETIELARRPARARFVSIPNGVDPVFTPEGPRAEGDYVLAVATLEPRKNLGRAVSAAREAGVELRVVGARGWGGVEVDGWVGEVPDAELAALYRGARCVLYPSLYEGFGLPVVEAMACGTPVVTSIGTAMEEVAGGAAVLVDPLDVSAIAAGIEQAIGAARRARSGRVARAARVHVGARGGRGRRAVARARVKVVAVDADVLGRQRTGDETYVLNLLRELGSLAPEAGSPDSSPSPAIRSSCRPASSRSSCPRARRSSAWRGRSRVRFARSAPTSATRSTRFRCARRARVSSRSTTCRSRATPV